MPVQCFLAAARPPPAGPGRPVPAGTLLHRYGYNRVAVTAFRSGSGGCVARRGWSGSGGAEAAQAEAVGYDEDRAERHRGGGDQRAEVAQGGQRDRGRVVAEGPEQVG